MIILGKVNKNKAREKDKDGLEMLTKKCQPYESKEELFMIIMKCMIYLLEKENF